MHDIKSGYSSGVLPKVFKPPGELTTAGRSGHIRCAAAKFAAHRRTPDLLKRLVEKLIVKAENGNPVSQFFLGFCYDNGEGIPQDHREAVTWYRRAAEQGDSNARYELGFYYKMGQGVEEHNEQTVKWFEKAARQGSVEASFFSGFAMPKRTVCRRASSMPMRGSAWLPPATIQMPLRSVIG